MNWNEISHNPMALMLIFGAAFIIWTKLKPAIEGLRTEYRRRTNAIEALGQSQDELARVEMKAASILDIMSDNQEKIMTGTIKACEAIVVATEKHRETVAEFSKLVFPENKKDALQYANEVDKDRIYSEMGHRAAGKSDDEAAALAEEEAQRPTSYMTETGIL